MQIDERLEMMNRAPNGRHTETEVPAIIDNAGLITGFEVSFSDSGDDVVTYIVTYPNILTR